MMKEAASKIYLSLLCMVWFQLTFYKNYLLMNPPMYPIRCRLHRCFFLHLIFSCFEDLWIPLAFILICLVWLLNVSEEGAEPMWKNHSHSRAFLLFIQKDYDLPLPKPLAGTSCASVGRSLLKTALQLPLGPWNLSRGALKRTALNAITLRMFSDGRAAGSPFLRSWCSPLGSLCRRNMWRWVCILSLDFLPSVGGRGGGGELRLPGEK